jgi:elongation factor Ts
MAINAQQVKELREKTGAGMGDCKKALEATAGDQQKAQDWLREKGILTAQKKAGRSATEGMIGHYIHMGGKIGVLVEVNSETDFTAKNEKFQALVKDIAMHIAAMNPSYVRREEVPAEVVEKEKSIFRAQLLEQGKPEAMMDKILPGKLDKFFKEACLLEQGFFKDPEGKRTVNDEVIAAISTIGENLSVRRFVRFALGEGLQKATKDFAAEVSAAVGGAKA